MLFLILITLSSTVSSGESAQMCSLSRAFTARIHNVDEDSDKLLDLWVHLIHQHWRRLMEVLRIANSGVMDQFLVHVVGTKNKLQTTL